MNRYMSRSGLDRRRPNEGLAQANQNSTMKKSTLSVLLGGTFLVGIVIGIVVAGVLWLHVTKRSVESRVVAANVAQEITDLRNIRDRHPDDVAEMLEIHLDGYIISLGTELGKVPPTRRDPWLVRALERARDYRQMSPHRAGSPDDEALVQKAFNLVRGKDGA